MTLERPALPLPGPARVLRDFGADYAASGLIAFIFAATGPVAIILAVGARGGLSEAEIASWLFGAFFLNGVISAVFCLLYRQPLVFFWTIPGAVLVGPALGHMSFAEVIGAYYATGVLMLLLGLSGWVGRAMRAAPMPIVLGMVAGVFLKFGVDWVLSVRHAFWIAGPMTLAFFALSVMPAVAKRLPPLVGALIVGVVALVALDGFAPGADFSVTLAAPVVQTPVFSWQAMVELVVPLAITVLVVQNGQGFAVLTASGHKPPINAVAAACGVGSIAAAVVGTVSTCLTGPVNAILAASGERARQYTAGLVVALLALAFGLMSPFFTRFLLATPEAFILTLGGLAMLPVLRNSFVGSFKGKYTMGALVTFLITVSGISIANIGAPFWGLVFGYIASRLLEPDDFREERASAS